MLIFFGMASVHRWVKGLNIRKTSWTDFWGKSAKIDQHPCFLGVEWGLRIKIGATGMPKHKIKLWENQGGPLFLACQLQT